MFQKEVTITISFKRVKLICFCWDKASHRVYLKISVLNFSQENDEMMMKSILNCG